MERMKTPKALGLVSLSILAALLFTTCKNPVSLFEEVKVEVMKANDRVLNVEAVYIPKPEGTFNPTDTIDIRFDKEIDLPSYGEVWKYVRISKTTGVGAGEPIEYQGEGVQYIPSTRTLRIQVRPYLEANTEFILEIDNLVSAAGNYQILEKGQEIFRTSNMLVGSIVSVSGSDGTSLAGYTTGALVDLVMHVNSPFSGLEYRYEIYIADPLTMVHSSIWYARPTTPVDGQFTHSDLNLVLPPASQEDGIIALLVKFYGRSTAVQEKEGISAEASIIMDQLPPTAGSLVVNGEAEYATTDTVSLSFSTAPADDTSGVGSMRYSNDGTAWSAWEDYSAAKSWSLSSDAGGSTTEGDRLVHYQIRDKAGNIASGQAGINLDLTPPAAPVVSGLTLTNSLAHEWTWVSGGGGNGTFRYQLNGVSDHDWISTESASYAPAGLTPNMTHIVYVQERDAAGNWSDSGSWLVEIDTLPPDPPVVSGEATTSSLRPVWTWSTGGNGGSGSFEYRLGTEGAWTAPVGSQYEPDADLAANVTHTLYVRERDAAGNWSEPGSWSVVIDTIPPNPPIVSGPMITNNPQPTWNWISGGGGGSGEFRYQFDSEAGSWITAGTVSSYKPSVVLSDFTTYTLYVQECDAAGNWSASGSKEIEVNSEAAAIPEVSSSVSLTNNQQPTWTWVWTGEGSSPVFQYKLNDEPWSSETSATTFTPGSPLPGGTYTLYVQQKEVGTLWSPSGNWSITIDTDPPYAPSVAGTSPTNNRQPTWSWASGGNDGAGIWRYQLGSTSGTWTDSEGAAYTPGSQLAEGSYTLYVQERDAAGNWSAAGSLAMVVDLTPPAAPSVTGPEITNFQRPTWSWTSGGLGGSGYYEYQLNSTSGSWSQTSAVSFIPSSDLPANTTHTLYVRERDEAGNWSEHNSFTLIIDTVAPAAPSLPDLAAVDDSGSSSSDNITRNTSALTFSGTADLNTTIQLKTGTTILASTTVDSSGFWSVDISRSAGTYSIYAVATDLAGNTSPSSSSMTLIVDTTAPSAPSVPDLATADDSGSSSSDNITRFTTGLTFSGTTEAYATVQLKTGTTVLATTTANSAGAWGVDINRSVGTYSIYAVATDLAGNTGSNSASMTLTVDTTAPAAPSVPDLAAVDDTGSSSTDNITKNTTGLTFSGTAEAYATVQLKTGTTVLATTTASSAGSWSADISRSSGTYSIYAVATDRAGNTGSNSTSMSLTVDTTAPSAPTTPDLSSGDDSGSSSTDNVTKYTTYLTFLGTAEAYATVQLKTGTTVLGTTTASSTGSWAFDISRSAGSHVIYAVATDAAGNVSANSSTMTLVVDTTAPGAPSIPDLYSGDDTGTSSTDNITNITSGLTFSGTSEAYAVVSLKANGAVVATTTANSAGSWTVDISRSAGTYTMTASQTDLAGNVGTANSSGMTLTVDTTPPNAPILTYTAVHETAFSVTWSSGGNGGAGRYDYELNDTTPDTSGGVVNSTATSYTTLPLVDGWNRFFVKERDTAGNLSAYGEVSRTINITTITPDNGAIAAAATGTGAVTFTWPAPIVGYRDEILFSTNAVSWSSQAVGITNGSFTDYIPPNFTIHMYWKIVRTNIKSGFITGNYGVYQATLTRGKY